MIQEKERDAVQQAVENNIALAYEKINNATRILALIADKNSENVKFLQDYLKQNDLSRLIKNNPTQFYQSLDQSVENVIKEEKKRLIKVKRWQAIKSVGLIISLGGVLAGYLMSFLDWHNKFISLLAGVLGVNIALTIPLVIVIPFCLYAFYKVHEYYKKYQEAGQELSPLEKKVNASKQAGQAVNRQANNFVQAGNLVPSAPEEAQQRSASEKAQEKVERLKKASTELQAALEQVKNYSALQENVLMPDMLRQENAEQFHDKKTTDKTEVLKEKMRLFRRHAETSLSPDKRTKLEAEIAQLKKEITDPNSEIMRDRAQRQFNTKKYLAAKENELEAGHPEHLEGLTKDIIRLNKVLIALNEASDVLKIGISAPEKERLEKLMSELYKAEGSLYVGTDINTEAREQQVESLITQLEAAIKAAHFMVLEAEQQQDPEEAKEGNGDVAAREQQQSSEIAGTYAMDAIGPAANPARAVANPVAQQQEQQSGSAAVVVPPVVDPLLQQPPSDEPAKEVVRP